MALGVQRSEGHTFLPWVYVEPLPGVGGLHTPIPAGPLVVTTHDGTRTEQYTVLWPGLESGPAVSSRVHTRIILQEVSNE